MAQAIFSNLNQEHEVISAGTKLSGPPQPLEELLPGTGIVIDAMKEIGIDLSKHVRKEVTQEIANDADKIIMVIDERDPVPEYLLNNSKVTRWDVLDPKGQTLEFAIKVRKQIEGLVKDLIQNLS